MGTPRWDVWMTVQDRWGLVFLIVASVNCHGPPTPAPQQGAPVVIRVNQVGYPLDASKVAVVCALESREITSFRVRSEERRVGKVRRSQVSREPANGQATAWSM